MWVHTPPHSNSINGSLWKNFIPFILSFYLAVYIRANQLSTNWYSFKHSRHFNSTSVENFFSNFFLSQSHLHMQIYNIFTIIYFGWRNEKKIHFREEKLFQNCLSVFIKFLQSFFSSFLNTLKSFLNFSRLFHSARTHRTYWEKFKIFCIKSSVHTLRGLFSLYILFQYVTTHDLIY
jgi:hypothetical protein